RLFGLAGARVALIERRPDPAAYKVVCTHQILSSAVPTIERLGLAPLIEARGAVRTHVEAWSPYGGWMKLPTDVPYGYGVTRRTYRVGCARTTASSTSPTGAAFGRVPRARGCGSSTLRGRPRFPTRAISPSWSARRTARGSGSFARTPRLLTSVWSRRCQTAL